MDEFSEEFGFEPGKDADCLTATGEWHGDDDVQLYAIFAKGNQDKAIEVLHTLHRNWRGWRTSMIEAIEQDYGDPGDFWIEAIHGYDGGGADGYFEIEFSAPDLFGDDLAMAVGTIGHGFEEVGIAQ